MTDTVPTCQDYFKKLNPGQAQQKLDFRIFLFMYPQEWGIYPKKVVRKAKIAKPSD